jgi:hypothetical protein
LFGCTDLVDDIEGVATYVILGQVGVVLGVLHIPKLVAHFFIHEETQCISDGVAVVGVDVAVHVQDDRAVAYHRRHPYLNFSTTYNAIKKCTFSDSKTGTTVILFVNFSF